MMWNAWKWFWGRFLGRHVHEEWTQWQDHTVIMQRAAYPIENFVGVTRVNFTKRWQERQCTLCGFIQQRELKHSKGKKVAEEAAT